MGSGSQPFDPFDREFFASQDPVSFVLDYVDHLQGQLDDLNRQMGELRCQDEQLRCGLKRINRDISTVQQMQRDLLPRSMPPCRGLKLSSLFVPAETLSGDMYNIVRLNDHQVVMNVSDATGHGLAAALLSIFTEQSIRGGLEDRRYPPDPNRLLQRVNAELMHANLTECQFVTSTCVLFDESTRELVWARGGTPHPILIRDGQKPIEVPAEGGLLGIFDQQDFQLIRDHLGPRDLMLFFSDGLESLLLSRTADRYLGGVVDTEWFQTLTSETLETHFQMIEQLIRDVSPADWPVDDVTILSLEGQPTPS